MAEDRPYYRMHLFCCTNERPQGHPRGSCAALGATKMRNYMKARAKELGLEGVRVNSAGCLDRCERGPVIVVYPEGTWYSANTFEDIDAILQDHIQGGQVVARLQLPTNLETLILGTQNSICLSRSSGSQRLNVKVQ